ncbi:MAG: transposase [Colwellia sp.]|nr:transposase [Colwellia sp.]
MLLRSSTKYRKLEKYGENDFLVERDISTHARKKSPSLPHKWQMRVVKYQLDGYEPQEIATSLPIEQYSAAQVIELYHERWEIELGYREIKKTLLKNAITLRSKKPDLVIQELYGMLIAYNLIRHEAALAGDVVKLRATRISFKRQCVLFSMIIMEWQQRRIYKVSRPD